MDRSKEEFSEKLLWLGEELGTVSASKVTEAQGAFVLEHGKVGTPVAEVCRMAEISEANYFNW